MTPDEIRTAVLGILGSIAPEADLGRLEPGVSLRDQLDIDSMDFLNFVVALHKQFRIDVPERDYPHFATLDGCVRYLAAKGASPPKPPPG
jgi:acyl carrier protein